MSGASLGAGLFFIVLGYLIGSVPWGLLIGKFNGLDIRKHGSHNIGATNVRRVLGRDWGILCFILDCCKGLVPVLIASRCATGEAATVSGLVPVFAAGAAVAGHVWPFWIGFKGGKGVATSIGALVALAPLSVVIALLAWIIVFYSLRVVSVASLAAALMLPLSAIVLRLCGRPAPNGPTIVLLLALAALIILRHKENVKRLRAGTELGFGRKKRAAGHTEEGESREEPKT